MLMESLNKGIKKKSKNIRTNIAFFLFQLDQLLKLTSEFPPACGMLQSPLVSQILGKSQGDLIFHSSDFFHIALCVKVNTLKAVN